jgi:ribonuclease HI
MYEVFVDGSVRCGNPGLAGIAMCVKHNDKCVYKYSWLLPLPATSNEAEYEAVLAALTYLKESNKYLKMGKEKCVIVTDSQLVYGHVVKNWKCNFAHLRVLRDEVKQRLIDLPFEVTLRQMSREENEIANELAQSITEQEKARRGNGRV